MLLIRCGVDIRDDDNAKCPHDWCVLEAVFNPEITTKKLQESFALRHGVHVFASLNAFHFFVSLWKSCPNDVKISYESSEMVACGVGISTDDAARTLTEAGVTLRWTIPRFAERKNGLLWTLEQLEFQEFIPTFPLFLWTKSSSNSEKILHTFQLERHWNEWLHQTHDIYGLQPSPQPIPTRVVQSIERHVPICFAVKSAEVLNAVLEKLLQHLKISDASSLPANIFFNVWEKGASLRAQQLSLTQRLISIVFFLVCFLTPEAHGMDWQNNSSAHFSAEGGYLSGTKVPISSKTQQEYDDESSKTGLSPSARAKIKSKTLRGLEGYSYGHFNLGYEGTSDDQEWKNKLTLKGSAGLGNSTGWFFSPADDPIFPLQGLGGRSSGWLTEGQFSARWVPFNGFTAHLNASFGTGYHKFEDPFSRLRIEPGFKLNVDDVSIAPSFLWQQLLASNLTSAAEMTVWSIDLKWLIDSNFRIENPPGYPLVKVSHSAASASPLIITALENEGRFFEINLTPQINLSKKMTLVSHFRSVTGSEQSYIAPSLSSEVLRRGQQLKSWELPTPSAKYISQLIEWRNSLNFKLTPNWKVYTSLFYTSQSYAFEQTLTSNFRYSDLLDEARVSTMRYFLGCEFLFH